MFGLINRFVAHPGQRDALVASMTADVGPLAGCRSFVVAIDPADAVTVWITEVWESKSAWEVSLTLSGVEESIRVAIPLVADWGCTTQTEVVSIAGSGSPPP